MMLDLRRDSVYQRQEIHDSIGGQRQYGISTPHDFKTILLFTGASGKEHGYHDGWRDDGIFLYSGEGQTGDMTFVRGNAEIRDHQKNGKELHLFQILGGGQVKYIGQMICTGYNILDEDTRGIHRKTIQFALLPIDAADASDKDVQVLLKDELSTLRKKAMASSSTNTQTSERKVTIRERSTAIRAYGLKRANGVCEYCQSKAPFITSDGILYLEVHHIKKLADGGPDHPDFVIGICPNCHRRAHYGVDREQVNKSMLELVKMIEGRINRLLKIS